MPRPDFMPPDSYIRFFDWRDRSWKYIHLVEREAPILYPFRFAALAPGTERAQPFAFRDLAPDRQSFHIYQAFLGLYPEFLYKLWHPANTRLLTLDERVQDVSEDIVSVLRYDHSPHDSPRISVWTDEQRFPAIQPRNVGRDTKNPAIEWTVAKYRVMFDENIDPNVKQRLVTGEIPSTPITFGGEI